MARTPSRVLRIDELDALLEQPLDSPDPILDALVTASAKGQDVTALWMKLHATARRDEKAAELAFAYEHLAQDRRIKLVQPDNQAAIFLNAASFFADDFDDPDGAITFIDRALAVVPGHELAAHRLQVLLERKGDLARLAKLYAELAAHQREPEAQAELLNRALSVLEAAEGVDDVLIDVCQKLLRIDPSHTGARETLERSYIRQGKPREATKVLEQALLRDPPPPEAEAFLVREHLIDLYSESTREPHRAVPHIEAVLASQPDHVRARNVAEGLLDNKAVAARVAAALSDAYGKLGLAARELELLNVELKLARGPRRLEVQRRLGLAKRAAGDPTGALELLGPVVAAEPGDDEVRQAYVELTLSLDQPGDAARLLTRALATCKDPAARARVGADVGFVHLRAGDAKRAQAALQQVLDGGEDDGAVLAAAKKLAEMFTESGDLRGLATALDAWVRFEPDAEVRLTAARRLAKLAEGELAEPERATVAWRALVDSPWADEALSRLSALYEGSKDVENLVFVLERRAQRAKNPEDARALALRAAELRTGQGRDRAQALGAWRAFIAQYGPSREAHARMIPLLEQEQQWKELAWILERDVEQAPREEWPPILARLAQIRLTRLGELDGAFDAYSRALEADPANAQLRSALEKLLANEDARPGAVAVLEPVYRAEGPGPGLLRLLEAKSELAEGEQQRLDVLAEAAELAQGQLADPERALAICARALSIAVDLEAPLGPWLERVRQAGDQLGAPGPRAEALSRALGDRAVDRPELAELAREAGEGLVAAGEVDRAVQALRRALAFEPGNAELMGMIDDLLAQGGNPEERLALYSSALEKATEPRRRRELLHAMARLQGTELADPSGAIATFRAAVADDERDLVAHAALVDLFARTGDLAALYAELERALPLVEGARRVATVARMAEVCAERGDVTRSLTHYRELLDSAALDDGQLETIELLANSNNDADTLRAVLQRRVAVAAPEERAGLLEKLGIVLAKQLGSNDEARRAWLEGAALAEAAMDEERARRLYERVLTIAPKDAEAALRLVGSYAKSGQWDALLEVVPIVLADDTARPEALARVLALEAQAAADSAHLPYARLLDTILAAVELEPPRRRAVLFAKATTLAPLAERRDEVAGLFRELLAEDADDTQKLADAFQVFLAAGELTPERIDDRRFLFELRARRASDPTVVLLAWASQEETTFGSPERAIEVYQRVLAQDPERVDVLTELSRLLGASGRAEEALVTLGELRERTEGDSRTQVDLARAELLLGPLERPSEALDVIEGVLDHAPQDAGALQLVKQALGLDELRSKAARLLERLASASETPEGRAELLESLLAVSAGIDELAESRGRWFVELLGCYRDDDEAGYAIALRGAEERANEGELWDAAERLARRLDRPEPLSEAYARALERPLTPEVAEELGRRMVEFHEEWFDDQERIVLLLRRVLSLSPAASWALDRLKLAFNAQGRWDDLFELYDWALVRVEAPAERIDLLREASMAAKDFASNSDRAIRYLEELLRLTPQDSRVEASLERLYERDGRTESLIELLAARLNEATAATDPQALRGRIAGLWLDLGDAVRGYELIESMLKDGADSELVRTLLERLVALPAARDSMAPSESPKQGSRLSVRHAAAAWLKDQYSRVGSLLDVARMLEVELELARTKDERIAGLESIVALRLGELGDVQGAVEPVAQLVGLVPSEARYRAELARLSQQLGMPDRRVEVLVAVADGVSDEVAERSLVLEAAEVRRDELGDVTGAVELFERALELAGDAADAALHAARSLAPLLAELERHAERADVLERVAGLSSDPLERREALGEVARVAATHLDDLSRAIRCLRERLAGDAGDLVALDALCDVLERAGRDADLVEALQTRAELRGGSGARDDRVRVAWLLAERLASPERAVEAWQLVERDHGADEQSFRSLVRLLGVLERYDEVAERLAQQARSSSDPEAARTLWLELGALHRDRTHQLSDSIAAFVTAGEWTAACDVTGLEGGDRERAKLLLSELFERARTAWLAAPQAPEAAGPERAAAWALGELAARHAADGRHEQVVELLVLGHELPFEQHRQRTFLRDAACIASDQLQNPARAIELFARLFAQDAADDVAEAVVSRYAKLLEDADRFADLTALWEEQARVRARASDLTRAAVLWARAAETAEGKAGDVARAIADHREGAALGGEASLGELSRLYMEAGQPLDAAHVLEWMCAGSSREALGPRVLSLAEAYAAAGDPDTARARLEAALSVALDGAPIRERLAALYREAEEWGPLADLLTRDASGASDDRRRLALLREAADLYLRRVGEPLRAVELLEQAAELDPDETAIRRSLADAHARAGSFDEAVRVLRDQVERYGTRKPKDRALTHFQLARVCLSAGRRAEAIAELDIANKINPAHPGILQALARLAFEEGQLDRAERMYRALLLVLGREDGEDAPSRAEALLDLAEIAERSDDRLRAEEFVESAFQSALEHDGEGLALERALADRGRHELLARAMRGRLARAESPTAASLALADLVHLYARHLGGLAAVDAELRARAVALAAEFDRAERVEDRAWEALARVFQQFGDSAEEARVLEQRLASMPKGKLGKVGAEPFYRLAELLLATEGASARGVDTLQRALELAPDLERAEVMLRRSLAAHPDDSRAAALFESVTRATGAPEKLLEALLLLAKLPEVTLEVVREGVALAESLGDVAATRRLLEAGVARPDGFGDEADAWLRLELAQRLESAGELEAALTLEEDAATRLPADDARARRLAVAAKIREQLGDLRRAASIYEAILRHEPQDREAWEPLLDVYRELDDRARLVEILEQTVPLVESASDRARLRLEQANLLLNESKVDDASQLLREILEEDPSHERASELLTQLYQREDRLDELSALLVSRIDAGKDRQDVTVIRAVSLQLGALFERLGRTDDAFHTYYAIVDWDRSSREVWQAVLRLAEGRDDPYLTAEALEGVLAATRGDEAVALAERLLALRAELFDTEGQERALELGFVACPGHAPLRDPLLAGCRERGDWGRAASLLGRALRATEDLSLLDEMLDAHRRASLTEDALALIEQLLPTGPDSAQLLAARARLLDSLERSDEAVEAFERATEVGADVAEDFAQALERASLRAEPGRERELSLRLVRLFDEHGDVDAARARLGEMTREAPGDAELWRRLAALDEKTERFDAAVTAYRKLISLTEGDELVRTALALAGACERAGRPEDARGGLERALRTAPEHAELRSRLGALYEALGEHRARALMLIEDAGAEGSVQARHGLLLAAGELLLRSEEHAQEGLAVLEEARGLSPESVEGTVLMSRALTLVGRGDEGMTLLSELVAASRGRRVKELGLVYREMSQMQLKEGFLDEALVSLTRAFEMDMKNARLALELGQLALDLDDVETAGRAFRAVTMLRAGEEEVTPELRAHAQFQLAVIARNQGDPRRAKILVSKALSENPEHTAARELMGELEAL